MPDNLVQSSIFQYHLLLFIEQEERGCGAYFVERLAADIPLLVPAYYPALGHLGRFQQPFVFVLVGINGKYTQNAFFLYVEEEGDFREDTFKLLAACAVGGIEERRGDYFKE